MIRILQFYDFEVFKADWLVVIISPMDKTKKVIVNDVEELRAYYNKHINDIWIGFNSRHYDQYVLKAILAGFNPKKINDWIIVDGRPGWLFSNLLRNFPLNNYDVMTGFHGLKQLEGFMGNNIKETSVDFNLDRKLTEAEISETIKYCIHDVEQTIEVFIQRKEDFDAQLGLIKKFNLPISYISKTKAQLSAAILGGVKQTYDDEFDIEFLDCIKLDKYKEPLNWFKNPLNRNYDKEFELEVAGVKHTFGWGGIHGAKEKFHGTGLIIHIDVTSYYPSLMIEYNLGSRSATKWYLFKEIYVERVELKKAGKKKEQAPLKIVLNGTYGILKDKNNPLYDPKKANDICVNGQLLLLDLIEKMEKIKGFELIQSNTDGLIVKIPNNQESFEQLDDVCFEWETRTKMGLGFDYITEIYQKDVNNYVFIQDDGKLERKGGYVKELNNLDYDLPIVNKALINYMINKIPIEETVNTCESFKDFQKIVKISGKYHHGSHNGDILNDKTFRVFASNSSRDSMILKHKTENAKGEKFANTPDSCFIENSNVNDLKIPAKLDRKWYIDLAYKRLNDFGLEGA